MSEFMYLPIVATNIFYVMIGYYVDKRIQYKNISTKKKVTALIAGFLAIIIMCLMTHYKVKVTGECTESVSQTFHRCLLAVPAIAVFYLSKSCCESFFSGNGGKIVKQIGSTTFGIMLFENILREKLIFIFVYLKPLIKTMPACIIWVLCVFVAGSLITVCLKKIPVIRRYL